jgi:hypothetical protein
LLGGGRLEEPEPSADDALKVIALQSIDAVPPVTANADDPGPFQDVKVPCRRRPTVAEAFRQVSGREFGPVVGKNVHDLAPRLVRQRVEHGRDLAE